MTVELFLISKEGEPLLINPDVKFKETKIEILEFVIISPEDLFTVKF